jgi:hypothetical protein
MTTKTCSSCHILKDVLEFNKNCRKKDGLNTCCKDCNKLYLKEHYKNNKVYYRNKARKFELGVRGKINTLKESKPCKDCGNYYPAVCMDFDHLDGDTKDFNIASFKVLGLSWHSVLLEIDKCELVCSNCHRIRTRDRITGM